MIALPPDLLERVAKERSACALCGHPVERYRDGKRCLYCFGAWYDGCGPPHTKARILAYSLAEREKDAIRP